MSLSRLSSRIFILFYYSHVPLSSAKRSHMFLMTAIVPNLTSWDFLLMPAFMWNRYVTESWSLKYLISDNIEGNLQWCDRNTYLFVLRFKYHYCKTSKFYQNYVAKKKSQMTTASFHWYSASCVFISVISGFRLTEPLYCRCCTCRDLIH